MLEILLRVSCSSVTWSLATFSMSIFDFFPGMTNTIALSFSHWTDDSLDPLNTTRSDDDVPFVSRMMISIEDPPFDRTRSSSASFLPFGDNTYATMCQLRVITAGLVPAKT